MPLVDRRKEIAAVEIHNSNSMDSDGVYGTAVQRLNMHLDNHITYTLNRLQRTVFVMWLAGGRTLVRFKG